MPLHKVNIESQRFARSFVPVLPAKLFTQFNRLSWNDKRKEKKEKFPSRAFITLMSLHNTMGIIEIFTNGEKHKRESGRSARSTNVFASEEIMTLIMIII